jgi:hypothetical protein
MFIMWPKRGNNYSIQRKGSIWVSKCQTGIFTLTELDLWDKWETSDQMWHYCYFSFQNIISGILLLSICQFLSCKNFSSFSYFTLQSIPLNINSCKNSEFQKYFASTQHTTNISQCQLTWAKYCNSLKFLAYLNLMVNILQPICTKIGQLLSTEINTE